MSEDIETSTAAVSVGKSTKGSSHGEDLRSKIASVRLMTGKTMKGTKSPYVTRTAFLTAIWTLSLVVSRIGDYLIGLRRSWASR